MTSYYSVVQFIPSPKAGERINIGVITYDEAGKVFCHFLQNWKRVNQFDSTATVTAVKRAVGELERSGLTPADIERMANTWSHSIQVTAPRVSLKDAESLLSSTIDAMLVDPERRHREDKRGIISRAVAALETAIGRRQDLLSEDVRVEKTAVIQGSVAEHSLDIGIRNGKLLHAAQAVEFNRKSIATPAMSNELGNLAWALRDIADAGEGAPPLSVLVGPPANKRDRVYVESRHVFEELNADVIEDSPTGLNRWVGSLVEAI